MLAQEKKEICVRRRPVICLLTNGLPSDISPRYAASFDIVCVGSDINVNYRLKTDIPDLFVSLKPHEARPDMEDLPLLLRRIWFEFDDLSMKTYHKIQQILAQRQLTCYVVTTNKNLVPTHPMVRFITPMTFFYHHTRKLEINFEYCFFLDFGLENDTQIRAFFTKIWPKFQFLYAFCSARYHKLRIPFRNGLENKLLFTGFQHMEPLMTKDSFVVESCKRDEPFRACDKM